MLSKGDHEQHDPLAAFDPPDLPAVEAIAEIVHPDFPEDGAVFAERQKLYGEGTRLLELDGVPSGYVLSHPWRFKELPALNALLGAVPDDADTYYIHDLALLNKARGTGAAAMIVGEIQRHARGRGFAHMSLVAVNGSLPFWHKHGFRALSPSVLAPELIAKLASYEATARFMVKSF
ncbi:GNAT family N-acetyltransferase [Devosia sp. J2-20]|uniref:GNAT family N-acetyltransferase n=1 Tax=Devosia sp. J2-20 TaxID=3026161 RepID=UPI00249A94F6|nr:GNAT family N-acetyltransferase [Devosia sp. J2-20]WDR00361.1 GNAT family N-acetyltransferase [Devosia sp. J2-20]